MNNNTFLFFNIKFGINILSVKHEHPKYNLLPSLAHSFETVTTEVHTYDQLCM